MAKPLDFSDLTGKGRKKEFTTQYFNDKEGALPKHIQEKADLVNKQLHQHEVKPQPLEQVNTQGFYSPDKTPDKKQPQPTGMGYPIQQTPAGDELMQLFPTPLLICP